MQFLEGGGGRGRGRGEGGGGREVRGHPYLSSPFPYLQPSHLHVAAFLVFHQLTPQLSHLLTGMLKL